MKLCFLLKYTKQFFQKVIFQIITFNTDTAQEFILDGVKKKKIQGRPLLAQP